MFSLFKPPLASSIPQHLLSREALLSLQHDVELLDVSATPSQPLKSWQTAGSLATSSLGSGVDYGESRVYQHGDDPRFIDWRLSARSHDTFVKTFHVESKPKLSLFLDKRKAMFFGTRRYLKVMQALRVAVLYASACQFYQLNFQAWILEENGFQYIDNIDAFIEQANNIQPSHSSSSTPLSVSALLKEIAQCTSTGEMLYLITDLAGIDEQSSFAQLQEQCNLHIIHIFDEAELSIPALGSLRFQAMDGDACYRLNSSAKKERLFYEDQCQYIFTQRKSLVTGLGIPYLALSTAQDNVHQYLSLPLGQS